jgi:hypothetical protein
MVEQNVVWVIIPAVLLWESVKQIVAACEKVHQQFNHLFSPLVYLLNTYMLFLQAKTEQQPSAIPAAAYTFSYATLIVYVILVPTVLLNTHRFEHLGQ